jgi:hypothetical protein
LHHAWRTRLRALGVEPLDLVGGVTGRQGRGLGIDHDAATDMVDRALEALAERQSTWRPAELVRELAAQVPTNVTVDPGELCGFLQHLSDQTAAVRCIDLSSPLPTGVQLRRDGPPVTEAAVHRALTTQHIIDEEEQLLEWAQKQRSFDEQLSIRRTGIADDHVLSRGQVEACSAVTGLAPVELIVGPAGTGKSSVLAPAVEELQTQGRPAVGVASTAAAASTGTSTEATSASVADEPSRVFPDNGVVAPIA